MDILSINGSRATNRGTAISKPGSELDKNAFLRILTAELSNQDPMNAKDSTEFVSQMAQFSALEQMSNLNTTMTMASANSLIGKGVSMRVADASGQPYTGILRGVTKQFGMVKVGVEVLNNGVNEILEFSFDDITSVLEIPDLNLESMSGNMAFLAALTMIDRKAEFNVEGEKKSGIVKGAYTDNGQIMLNVQVDNSDEILEVAFNKVSKVSSL
jgi:flagellar basal-body rod modification protein FlgD